MADNKSTISQTVSEYVKVITIVFVTLKLVEDISWSWWWVLSPVWIPLAIGLILFLIVVIMRAEKEIKEEDRTRRKEISKKIDELDEKIKAWQEKNKSEHRAFNN